MTQEEHKKSVAALVIKYINGDKNAFEKLYQETCGDFEKFLRFHFTGLTDRQVEDIIQSAYLRISNNIQKLKDPANYMPWGYKIVKTTGIDYLRKENKYVFPDDEEHGDGWIDMIPDESGDSYPEDMVYASDIRAVIIDALKCLSEETRETFCLFYLSHLKIDEVAKVQGIKSGTVKSRLHTAREKLRKELRAYRDTKD